MVDFQQDGFLKMAIEQKNWINWPTVTIFGLKKHDAREDGNQLGSTALLLLLHLLLPLQESPLVPVDQGSLAGKSYFLCKLEQVI